MRVAISGKAVHQNVGGNSTYVRNLVRLGASSGIEYQVSPMHRSVYRTLWDEAFVLAREKSADVIHYPTDTGPIARPRLPMVATVHGVANLHGYGVRGGTQERLWTARVKRTVDAADQLVTVSESSASDIARAFSVDQARIHVIYHGVDHSRFHPETSGDDAVLGSMDLPEEFVLFLGNLERRKNIHGLLAAMELTPNVQALPLVVAGRVAWHGEELVARMTAQENVSYVGQVADEAVAPLLRRAAAFVFPSFYEGFGLPVLEAMACGTPVITTKRGSLGEVAGDAAMFVDPESPSTIAGALSEISHDRRVRDELRFAGLKRAARFTWEESLARHREVYRLAAESRRSA